MEKKYPLQAQQVSKANLPSKQGDINVPPTTFVLFLPHTKNLDWGQFKTVCLCVAHTALQAHPQEFLEFQH
jgi:hypothetical protein